MENLRIEDLVIPYSSAPGLDIGPESVGGVQQLDDGSFKFVAVLKFQVQTKPGAKPEQGRLQCEIPVLVNRTPTVEELKATQEPLMGLIKLGPGVWKPRGPALRFTQQQAGFFTLTGCPDPAPWESASSLIVPA